MGETYDARKEIPGWSTPGFDDAAWQPVDVAETVTAKIEAYPGVLVRRVPADQAGEDHRAASRDATSSTWARTSPASCG